MRIRILLLMLFCIWNLNLFCQDITVKEIKELGTDFTASKFERKDHLGKSCAVVKIALPSIENITFSNHVGEVSNKAGEYIVYVSPGTTSLCIFKAEEPICLIDFTKSNIQIQSKHTYQVVLNVEQTREMVFHITPADAKLTVNGKTVALNEDGVGKLTCEPEVMYNYTIEAPNYTTIEDAFMLDPEENSLEPINIALDPKMSTVLFNSNVKEFEVIANNESYGVVENGNSLQLPYGNYTIRLISEQYEDWKQVVNITEENSTVNATMEKANDVSNKLRPRTTIFFGGGFAYDFNREIEMNDKNMRGYPLRAGLDYERYINRWFTFRSGLEFLVYLGDSFKKNDKIPFSVNIPLLFSLNLPLGKLNRHHFSVGVGPLLGFTYLNNDSTSITTDNNITKMEEIDKYDFQVGVRAEARFTLNHFILGASIDYYYFVRKVLAKDGLLAPTLTIGYKF